MGPWLQSWCPSAGKFSYQLDHSLRTFSSWAPTKLKGSRRGLLRALASFLSMEYAIPWFFPRRGGKFQAGRLAARALKLCVLQRWGQKIRSDRVPRLRHTFPQNVIHALVQNTILMSFVPGKMLPRLVRRIVIIEKSPSRLRFPSEFSVHRRLMAIFRMHNAPQPNSPRRGGQDGNTWD